MRAGDSFRLLALSLALCIAPVVAFAQESVAEFMERYETALDRADLDAMAEVYADWSERKRERLAAYFANEVGELNVEISNVNVTREESGSARVEFARRDRFTDLETGARVEKTMRLKRILERDGARWRFAAD